MNLEQTDRQLVHWHERLKLAGENLRAFAELPAYQWAAGRTTTGRTAETVAPAVAAVGDLNAYFELLSGVVDRATQLRGSVLLPSSDTLREIEDLLEGQSIALSGGPTPPANRELLRPVESTEAITPQRLLEAMLAMFRQVRDVVLEAAAARKRVAMGIARLERQLGELRAAAGAGEAAERTASRVAALKGLADADPLSAEPAMAALESELQLSRQRFGSAAAGRVSIGSALLETRSLLHTLELAHDRARELAAERNLKVDDGTLPAPEDGSVAALSAWLARLEHTVENGKWEAAGVGIARWRQEVERRIAADEEACNACEAALNRRRDLRGLLDALVAKARQQGRADDPELSALAGRAMDLLRQRPTPLARASAVVTEYEARLL